MALSEFQQPAPALMWDYRRLARDASMWSIPIKLAPTALAAAVFAVVQTGGHTWLLDILMSTDTAMGFTIQPLQVDPNIGNVGGNDLFIIQGPVNVQGEARVGAVPGSGYGPLHYGRIPLERTQSVWGRAPLYLGTWAQVMVYTDKVAGNVTCTFIGASFN